MSNDIEFTYKRPFNWRKFRKSPIFNEYPQEMIKEVLFQDKCELEFTFPGFLDIYESLAKIIPESFTILDLGCYLSAQCWYFRHHVKYVGVDVTTLKRFSVDNTEHYVGRIEDFLKERAFEFDEDNTFAIYNYVGISLSPLIAEKFPKCFCYFPGSNEQLFNFKSNEVMREYKKSKILELLGNKEDRDILYDILKEAKVVFN